MGSEHLLVRARNAVDVQDGEVGARSGQVVVELIACYRDLVIRIMYLSNGASHRRCRWRAFQ